MEYDNGGAIFSFYDNFSGTALRPYWRTTQEWNGSQDSGMTLQSSSHEISGFAPYKLPHEQFPPTTTSWVSELLD